jgi:Holliday junction resolvase RusA-like endonuclease
MTAITFEVAGDPVPQPRARISTRGGFGRAYVPGSHPVHDYRARLAEAARSAGLTDTGEPLNVVIDAVFARPKSHYRKAGVKPDAPKLPRPDVDNIGKAVLDALQDVMGDDTNVARLVVEKSYGPEARTVVRIS